MPVEESVSIDYGVSQTGEAGIYLSHDIMGQGVGVIPGTNGLTRAARMSG